jgi:hypothetical protein
MTEFFAGKSYLACMQSEKMLEKYILWVCIGLTALGMVCLLTGWQLMGYFMIFAGTTGLLAKWALQQYEQIKNIKD